MEQRRLSSFKMAAARAHYKKACKDTILRAWLDYVAMRRRKRRLRDIAMEMHTHNMKARVWSQWTTRTQEALQLAEWEESVIAMGNRTRLRRALIGWKSCILIP